MKAMLACNEEFGVADLPKLRYPVICSPKYDGIRGLSVNKQIMSRNEKPLPNAHVQRLLQGVGPFDGEVLVPGDFNTVQSVIMSHSALPSNLRYNVFDLTDTSWHSAPFHRRLDYLKLLVEELNHPLVRLAPQRLCNTPEEVIAFYEEVLAYDDPWDYDGLIIRDPNAPYKYGRSTLKQGWMLKLKPWQDDEGIIVGFEELLHNLDTSCKRQENMVGGDTLGKFILNYNGQELKVGGGKGLTLERRLHYWFNQEKYLGKKLTFKHLGLSKYGIPRHPNYKGVRLEDV